MSFTVFQSEDDDGGASSLLAGGFFGDAAGAFPALMKSRISS